MSYEHDIELSKIDIAPTNADREKQKEEQTENYTSVVKHPAHLWLYEAGVFICTICYFTACPIVCNLQHVCNDVEEDGGDGMCQWWLYVYASFWVVFGIVCFGLVIYKNTNWRSLRLIIKMPSFWAVILWICIIAYTDFATPYFSLSPINGFSFIFGQFGMLLLDAVKYKHRKFVIGVSLVAMAFNTRLLYAYIVTNKEEGVIFGHMFGKPLEKRPIKRSLFISVLVLLASSVKRIITDKEQKYLIFFESSAYRITNKDMEQFRKGTNSTRSSLAVVIERHSSNGETNQPSKYRLIGAGIIVCIFLYIPSCITIEYLDPTNTLGLYTAAVCCVVECVCIIGLSVALLRNNMSIRLLKRTIKEPKVIFVVGYCVFLVVLAFFNIKNDGQHLANVMSSFVYMSIVLSTICLDVCTLQIRYLKLVVVVSLFVLNTFLVFERVFGDMEEDIVFANYLSVTLMTRSLKRSAYFNINALILDGLWCVLFDKKDERLMFVKDDIIAEV